MTIRLVDQISRPSPREAIPPSFYNTELRWTGWERVVLSPACGRIEGPGEGSSYPNPSTSKGEMDDVRSLTPPNMACRIVIFLTGDPLPDVRIRSVCICGLGEGSKGCVSSIVKQC